MHAWVRSSTPNVDLQATITEVRPDGKETFVQSGWVRGNERKLDAQKSTLLEPVLSLRAADVSPMPRNRFVKVTIPLYYEGHTYRAGSRIRVTITAPNGDQPIWSFGETEPAGTADGLDRPLRAMPSSLILPVVPGVDVPTGLPPCPGLRGEPCRDYQPFVNRAAAPSARAGQRCLPPGLCYGAEERSTSPAATRQPGGASLAVAIWRRPGGCQREFGDAASLRRSRDLRVEPESVEHFSHRHEIGVAPEDAASGPDQQLNSTPRGPRRNRFSAIKSSASIASATSHLCSASNRLPSERGPGRRGQR